MSIEGIIGGWKEVRSGLIDEAEQIPADKFSFQAAPNTRSVAQLLQHIIEAQKFLVGEVSQPVRTPFGYHLIQILERRSSDLSPERRRMQARQALRERKADEAYQEWLRQLRDQTYVELRLEER